VRLVVNGAPTDAAVRVKRGEQFAVATFPQDLHQLDVGAAIELWAWSSRGSSPDGVGVDGFLELES
jgi:hypothetical protein